MKYFRPTVIFIVSMAILIVAYDVWAVSHDSRWTISATTLQAAIDWPPFRYVFCVLVGILIGHLFPNSPSGGGAA